MDKAKILETIDAALAALQGLEYALYNDDRDVAKAELSSARREILHLYILVSREKEI